MAHFGNLAAAIGRSGPRKQWEHRDSRLFNWQRGLNFVGLAGTPEADNASDRYGALLPFPWSPLTRKSLNGVKDRDSTYNGDESPFVFSRCEILGNLFSRISFGLYTRSYRVFPLSWIFILIKYFYWYRKWCEDGDHWFRNRNIVIYDFPAERYCHRICEAIETVLTFLFLKRINLKDILIKIL